MKLQVARNVISENIATGKVMYITCSKEGFVKEQSIKEPRSADSPRLV